MWLFVTVAVVVVVGVYLVVQAELTSCLSIILDLHCDRSVRFISQACQRKEKLN